MSLYLKKRKKFLKKVFVGSSLFALGVIFTLLITAVLKSFYPSSNPIHFLLPVLITSFVAMLGYKPLDKLYTQFFRHYLFKHRSYAQLTLMNLAEELSLVLDLQEFSNLVINTFGEVLNLKTAAILVPSRLRGDFEIVSSHGWPIGDTKRVRLSKESVLLGLIQSTGPHILVKGQVDKTLSWQDANRLARDFDQLHAGWIIPLFAKEELVGAIGFSSANPHTAFDESDFQFFRQFASAIGKSLRNALSVAELKTANEELQDVQSQLLQATKLNAIEQLATGIAHEIHNPLTIISGKAQVLLLQKDRNHIDERVEEVLKTIVKQTKRAADITRKLLMFSQSSGSPKEVLRLEQVLEDTIALVSYQTSLEGIELTKQVASAIPPVYANLHEIREVFLNLVLNAVQSVGSRGKIHCEILDRMQDQIVEFRISDTGPGIPEEHINKLFNPFFTTRPDAVGLGLFVTKQVVHRYGGSIRVESLSGKGSLFTVQWPYMEPPVSLTGPKEASLSLFPA
jgi:signal transduction histidine kinase